MSDANKKFPDLRNVALGMLLKVEKGEKSDKAQKETLDGLSNLSRDQRAFISQIFKGTIERKITLDYILNTVSSLRSETMRPVVLEILRMAAYQLYFMDSVPRAVATNEAVRLSKKRRLGGLSGFINGVLRNMPDTLSDISYPDTWKEKMSVCYSVPSFIIEMWSEQYGQKKTEEILLGCYEKRSTSVRVNPSKEKKENIIKSLEDQGVCVEESQLYDNALFISKYDNIGSLDAFQNGWITVQDISSMLVGVSADISGGEYIVDLCAAPGGKALHMAELLGGSGTVDARDRTEKKTRLIEENNRRTKYDNIKISVADATVFDANIEEKADIVLADLPCSGLGVMGRKNDIKYNVSSEKISELVELQRQILLNAGRYVKSGGKLVFSTCTINRMENDDNALFILKNMPFEPFDLRKVMPKGLDVSKNTLQIFPGKYGMDGFFISVFVKK